MRFFDAGSGPPLIVVPGVQGRWEWIRPALEQLRQRCRTISYSLCGDFGSGRRLDASRGFDNYLDQLDDVFDQLRLEQAAVCGISYGGLVALRYAATRPGRVSALIIASSPAPGWVPNPVQRAYIASPWRKAPKFILTSPFRIWPEIHTAFGSPLTRLGFLARHGVRVAGAPMIPALMAARIVEQQAMDFTADCARVQAPTLIVTGEPHLDRIVPVESTRRYVGLIPGAKYALIERTGHLGLITRPEAFAWTVSSFVEEHSSRGLKPASLERSEGRLKPASAG
ncbi:MAG TPA: alpha/beta hydrolase [Vicinamibacterales bacterium]|nr:alpha/beta hydrolase [Vicinamibacterales bacterium]